MACALPGALFALHHDVGHRGDIAFFHEWARAFSASAAFYRDGPGINYPIAGVLLVCGPAWIAERALGAPLDLPAFTLLLKGTIAAGEIAFIVSAAALTRALGADRPRVCALLLYALPSSWAGGAWFGQIDPLGSALLCASAAALIRYRERGRLRTLVLGLLALHAAVLLKQLTWLAAPPLVVLAGLGLQRHREPRAIAVALASPLLLVAADPLLVLPEGFHSHLAFVLARGSSHGELAVASGASVWSFVAPGGTPAAAIRFVGVGSQAWGWLLWMLAVALGAWRVARARLSSRAVVALAGISSVAMATLLTGVHERYLAHAIPLLLLAETRRWRRALGVAVALLSGAFVLSTLHYDAFTGPLALLAHPWPTALASLAWLVSWLADSPLRARRSPPRGRADLPRRNRRPVGSRNRR